jgi:hypothetical protein
MEGGQEWEGGQECERSRSPSLPGKLAQYPFSFVRSQDASSEDFFGSDWCCRRRRQQVTLLPESMHIPRT